MKRWMIVAGGMGFALSAGLFAAGAMARGNANNPTAIRVDVGDGSCDTFPGAGSEDPGDFGPTGLDAINQGAKGIFNAFANSGGKNYFRGLVPAYIGGATQGLTIAFHVELGCEL